MVRIVIAVWGAFLLIGCLESNPQPSPGTGLPDERRDPGKQWGSDGQAGALVTDDCRDGLNPPSLGDALAGGGAESHADEGPEPEPGGLLKLPTVTLAPGPRSYQVVDGKLTTAAGQSLFLRGLNIDNRSKYAPGFLLTISDQEIAALPQQGINLVRLLTFWNALAPAGPGDYDDVYLGNYLELLKKIAGEGMLVVVDMHQDLWGPPFEKHGAPPWACPDELKQGYQAEEPWWINYLKPQVVACFDQFWQSEALQQQYAQAWAHLAAAVCEVPEVIGFDLMNEPFAGSFVQDPQFESQGLFGLYLRVIAAIEEVCPGRLYFLEHSWTFGVVSYDPMPLQPELQPALVFSPHYYRPELHEPSGAGYTLPEEELFEIFDTLWASYRQAGWPIWLGEFGGFTDKPGFGDFLDHCHRYLEQRGGHSALYGWGKTDDGFSFVDGAGQLKPVFHPRYLLPFPTALPGIGASYEQDPPGGTTTAHFDCTPGTQVRWLLPAANPTNCTINPPDRLTHQPTSTPFQHWLCQDAGPVEMICEKPPAEGTADGVD